MVIYDKLKNMEIDEEYFGFKCNECNIDGMKKGVWEFIPIGISYKPTLIDNSDIKNKMVRIYYDGLPNKRQAIFTAHSKMSDGMSLCIKCNNCNNFVSVNRKIALADLRKWLNKNIPHILNLRINKDDRNKQ